MSNQKKYLITKLSLFFFAIAPASLSAIVNRDLSHLKFQDKELLLGSNHQSFLYPAEVYPLLMARGRESQSETKPKPEKQSEPLDFSSFGRSGQQTAGESRGSCPQQKFPLTAIAAKSNANQTIASHPRWWFYIPYEKSQISKVEFVVQNQEREDLFRQDITISTINHYFSTTIPQTHSGIEPHNWYRWYLKVYCSGGESSVPLYVSGWVRRIISEEQIYTFEQKIAATATEYTKQNRLLDVIDLLLETYMNSSLVSKDNWYQTWKEVLNSSEIDLTLPLPNKNNITIE